MNKANYIIGLLLVATWFIEDAYHLAPGGYRFTPFFFSEKSVTLQRYIFDIAVMLQYMIYLVCIYLAKQKLHRIIKDTIAMTIFLKSISLLWYLTKYGNQYYHSEWYVIFIVSLIIFGAIEFEKWDERNNNSHIHHRN